MKTYQIATEVCAPADMVWRVLTQVMPGDPKPFGIVKLEGALREGGRLKLWSEVDPKRAFSLKVMRFEPPHGMVWQGGMPFGLFTGTRSFEITTLPNGSRFEMREVFSGLLSGLIVRSMPDLHPSFAKFAQTLKERAEDQ